MAKTKADTYIVDDRESDYAPYGFNGFGTPFRPDGSPINYGGNGDFYVKNGGSQDGFRPNGNADRDSTAYKGAFVDTGYYKSNSGGSSGSSYKRDSAYSKYNSSVKERNKQYEEEKTLIDQGASDVAKQAFIKDKSAQLAARNTSIATGFSGGEIVRRRMMMEQSYNKAVENIKKDQAKQLTKAQMERDRDIEKYYQSYISKLE